MSDGTAQPDLRREVEALKQVVQDQREEINQLKETMSASIIESLGLNTPTGRRQAMKYGLAGASLPALLSYAVSQEGKADAVAADIGTEADPWRKVWVHEIGAGDGASEITFADTANVGNINGADVSAATEGHALTKGASGTDLEFEAVSGEIERNSVQLSDGGKAAVSAEADVFSGVAFIDDGQGNFAFVRFDGTQNSVTLISATAAWSTTEDSDGGSNVYWDPGNSRYEINNELGITSTYTVLILAA